MIVLDTHILLWRELQPELLSANSRLAIESAQGNRDPIAISAATLWEIAQIVSRGRIRLLVPLAEFLAEIEENYVIIPLTGAVAAQAATFDAPFPKDPMDKLIGASAVVTQSTLITADRKIHASHVCSCVW
jgi:PIN domain nuclease of toxin-antitoxin system